MNLQHIVYPNIRNCHKIVDIFFVSYMTFFENELFMALCETSLLRRQNEQEHREMEHYSPKI